MIDMELERALLHIVIYGELFTSSMHAFYEPELQLPRFDLGTRFDYINYCTPDLLCADDYAGL